MFLKISQDTCEFWEIFKNTFFCRTLPVAASVNETKCNLNLFHVTGLFLYPLKTGGIEMRPVAWNGLIISFWEYFQPAFSCSKLAIEVIEQGVTCVQS